MCSMKGSAFRPSDVTMNGTLFVIRPAMKLTSRASRSSFATTTAHFSFLAATLGEAVGDVPARRCLAGLDLDELTGDLQAFSSSELGDGGALCFQTQARLALLRGRDPKVGDHAGHFGVLKSELHTSSFQDPTANNFAFRKLSFGRPASSDSAGGRYSGAAPAAKR